MKSAQVSQALAMALLHEVLLNQTRHVEPEDKTTFSELTKGVVNPEALANQQPHEENVRGGAFGSWLAGWVAGWDAFSRKSGKHFPKHSAYQIPFRK